MEHYIMDTDGINCLANQLGCTMEGTFYISEECVDTLEQLVHMVEREGPSRTDIRRRLGLLELLPKTLIPLIGALDAEENEDMDIQAIFSLSLRLIMYLTQPMDSMVLPRGCIQQRKPASIHSEMQEYLWQYKNAFLEKATLPVFFRHILAILDEAKGGQLSGDDCETINVFLLVVRNIIFITPQDILDSKYTDIIILRLLFQAGLADLIIRLALMEHHVLWCAAIVQILSLIYKNRGSTDVQDFLSSSSGVTWVHSSLDLKQVNKLRKLNADQCHADRAQPVTKQGSSSSLNSPPESGESSTVSPVMSNSSESWSHYLHEEEWPGSQTGTSTSTGGNEADCSLSSEEKLDEHVKTSLMQIETKLCLTLNEFKVRQELMMFTYTMLQEGVFNRLVEALTTILMLNKNKLPDMYFMWLIVHFLRVAQQGKVGFQKIRCCLSVDIVSYLTYVGVSSVEELVTAGRAQSEVVFTMRRYHLALLAIQEIINSIHHLRCQDQTPDSFAYLGQLTVFLLDMRDLRALLLLTIRHHCPKGGNNLFLRDAIVLNHNFLSLAENMLSSMCSERVRNFNMLDHVRGFATMEVMAQYGSLLENYDSNSPLLNDCIFTMMHHVAGDCGAPHTLLQLPILRAFSDIWEDSQKLPQECQDLIHFTLDSFITQAEGSPYECAKYLFGNTPSDETAIDDTSNDQTVTENTCTDRLKEKEWSQQECDDLFMAYQDVADQQQYENIVGPILKMLEEKGIVKTEQELLLQLCRQNLCSEEEIVCYMSERAETSYHCKEQLNQEQPMVEGESYENISQEIVGQIELSPHVRDVKSFTQALRDQGHYEELRWVQTVLLETCYVKIGGRRSLNAQYPEEPVPLHYTLRNMSVPLVAYKEKQQQILTDPVFMLLMEMLGLHFPTDTNKAFLCIPHFWSPRDLLNAARKLGDVNFEEQKFCEWQVTEEIHQHLANVHKALISHTPLNNCSENVEQMSSLWNTFIQQCNINIRQNNAAMSNMVMS